MGRGGGGGTGAAELVRRLRRVSSVQVSTDTHSPLFSLAMAPRTQTSAAGVLALLSEPEPLLQQYALTQLNALVPQFWAEISESITGIETLYENEKLPKEARDMAALVASKVYYYLAEYDEALSFALGAGSSFEQERSNPGAEEYVETVVSKAIDRYIQLRAAEEAGEPQGKIDPRLATIIEAIFNKCLEDGEHKQVMRPVGSHACCIH